MPKAVAGMAGETGERSVYKLRPEDKGLDSGIMPLR